MNFRVGFGYDTHRLKAGRPLILGGVNIPYEKGLDGHSDADVLLHAIVDALLGAANLRDIGYHFADTDPQFKNMDSRIFLRKSLELLEEKGYGIGNMDCTIVAEKPKINPHIPAMQAIIAEDLKIDEDQVSIKATTNEKMDGVGQGEGMKAYAVAMIYKK